MLKKTTILDRLLAQRRAKSEAHRVAVWAMEPTYHGMLAAAYHAAATCRRCLALLGAPESPPKAPDGSPTT